MIADLKAKLLAPSKPQPKVKKEEPKEEPDTDDKY